MLLVFQAEPLLRFSGRFGFRHLTVPFLRKLAAELDIDFRHCKSELAIVTNILRNVFPNAEENDISSYAAMRHKMRTPHFRTELSEQDVATLGELFCEGDATEMKKDITDYVGKVNKMLAQSKSSGEQRGRSSRKKKMAPRDHTSLESARKYAPPAPFELTMETEWYSRWRGWYPCPLPPYSHSCTFEPDNDEQKKFAVQQVLRWGWRQHGARCPWDLGQ